MFVRDPCVVTDGRRSEPRVLRWVAPGGQNQPHYTDWCTGHDPRRTDVPADTALEPSPPGVYRR